MNCHSLSSHITNRPILSTGALLLCAYIGLKVAHQIPLMNPEERYIESLRDNEFRVPPLLRGYLQLNPYNTSIESFGGDSLIIQDYTKKRTFVLTCPDIQDIDDMESIDDSAICFLRDNPYTLKLTGTVFGSGIPLTGSIAKSPFQSIFNQRALIYTV